MEIQIEFDGNDYDRKAILTNLAFILLSVVLVVITGALSRSQASD